MNDNLSRLIRALLWRLGHGTKHGGTLWDLGGPPSDEGDYYVLVDGLASSSTLFLGRPPWSENLQQCFADAQLPGVACGLSYYGVRKEDGKALHYGPNSTNRNPSEWPDIFEPYAPRMKPEQSITYIGFCLGGLLLSLELASFLNRLGDASPADVSAFVPALILVQPAFTLSEAFLSAIEAATEELPGVVSSLFACPSRTENLIAASLQEILSHHVPIVMIVWPGDQLIGCPDSLTSLVTRVELLPNLTASTGDAYRDHLEVATDRQTKEHLVATLRSIVVSRSAT